MTSPSYVSRFLSQVTFATLPAVWQAASQTLEKEGGKLVGMEPDLRLAFLQSNPSGVNETLARRWGDFLVSFVGARLDHPPVLQKQPEPDRRVTQLLAMGFANVMRGLLGNPMANRTAVCSGFSTAAEALASLTPLGAVQVYGFGEYHPRNHHGGHPKLWETLKAPTSLEHFAVEMIPYLVREASVQVFGLEYLPAGELKDSNPVQDFLETGDFSNSLLSGLYANADPVGAMMALESLRRLIGQGYDLKVHGLHNDEFSRDHQLYHRSQGDFGLRCEDYLSKGIKAINDNALTLTEKALNEGKKVALYTGAGHSASRPIETTQKTSYVPDLWDLLDASDHYAEIRLLVPEYVAGMFDNGEDQILAERAPFRGVTLARRGPREHVMVYPGSFAPPSPLVLLLR